MSDLYLIWSFEHSAWWRPDSRGYTCNVTEAGLYSREEGEEIVAGHTDPVHETIVPARAAFEAFEVDARFRKNVEAERSYAILRCIDELQAGSEGDPRELQRRRLSLRARSKTPPSWVWPDEELAEERGL